VPIPKGPKTEAKDGGILGKDAASSLPPTRGSEERSKPNLSKSGLALGHSQKYNCRQLVLRLSRNDGRCRTTIPVWILTLLGSRTLSSVSKGP